MTEVTDADILAARDILATWPTQTAVEFAFARHRIAAMEAGARMMQEAAAKCCEFETFDDEQAWFARDKCADAIRALDPAEVVKGKP